MTDTPMRLLLLGGSGTIGRAVARAAVTAGHQVTAPVRAAADLPGCRTVACDVAAPGAVAAVLADHPADAVISCLASRTGAPDDAWRIDHGANSLALKAALAAGVEHFTLLSAICVQKPQLAFQHAKLAFEAELQAAPLSWAILRATAFFKSLSGQVARAQAGRPFLVFGDGRQTACKPISDRDLAALLVDSMTDPGLQGRILAVGGPGPEITPLDQVAMLERLLGRPVPVRRVPFALIDTIAGAMGLAARIVPSLVPRAEFARIGRYYARESMLVWDPAAGRYDADVTPEYGQDRLENHYAALLQGRVTDDRGAHAVF